MKNKLQFWKRGYPFPMHAGKVYRLMYWPVDVPEVQTDIDELVQTTLNSFAYLSKE